jgi:hypothetical protein
MIPLPYPTPRISRTTQFRQPIQESVSCRSPGPTTISFDQVCASSGLYLWGNAPNLTNGIPSGGSIVDFTISAASNHSGYNDIANLSIRLSPLTQASQVFLSASMQLHSIIAPPFR